MPKPDINLPLSDTKAKSSGFAGRALLQTSQEDIGGSHAWRLQNGSICSFSKQRTNSPHIHRDGYEVCLVLEGSGNYLHGGIEYPLGPGDLFLADPGVTHEISSHKTADLLLAFFVIFIGEPSLDDNPKRAASNDADAIIGRFLEGHAVIAGDCGDLADYIRLLTRTGRRQSAGSAFGTEALWRGFAFECLDRLASVKAQADDGRRRALTPLDKAVAYLYANSNRKLGIEEVAKAASLSSRQLRRLFRDNLGCEVRDMVADAKIQRSLHLLSMRFSVNEVAKAIGESNQAQFCRLFKRRVGVTPKEYQLTHAPKSLATAQSTKPSRIR